MPETVFRSIPGFQFENPVEYTLYADQIQANFNRFSPCDEEDISNIFSTGVETPIPLEINVEHLRPETPGYGQHLRASFQFFRRHAQNRYSASTLMRLANAAGELDDRTRQGTEPSPRTSTLLPTITVGTRPSSYDEETEVKTGGTIGMMVVWPDGKSLFTIIASSRRQGIGRRLFNYNRDYCNFSPYFWVHANNQVGQHFLLAMGLVPTALNGNGAVRYGYSGAEE